MRVNDKITELSGDSATQRRLAISAATYKQQWWRGNDGHMVSQTLQCIAGHGLTEGDIQLAVEDLVKNTDWALRWLDFFTALQLEQPLMLPALRHFTNGVLHSVIIVDTPHVALSLAVVNAAAWQDAQQHMNAGTDIVSFTPGIVYMKILHGSGCAEFHKKTPHEGTHASCIKAGRKDVKKGSVIRIDGASQAMRFSAIDTDILMLRILRKPVKAVLKQEFDANSGALVFEASGHDRDTRTQMMLALLRTMKRSDTAPVMAMLARQGEAHMRWQAMRECIATDIATGIAELRHMAAKDEAPELRAIAARTLAELEAQYPQLRNAGCA